PPHLSLTHSAQVLDSFSNESVRPRIVSVKPPTPWSQLPATARLIAAATVFAAQPLTGSGADRITAVSGRRVSFSASTRTFTVGAAVAAAGSSAAASRHADNADTGAIR